ncbi:hypothetical protein C8R48DRAFT_781033 [Suillus tomentosus]|nr:hypothetical protein C8R48DRAFT_781033 [Suillus tomentosus]
MSEYWVSRKRHHCKYCNIYIANDAPSKQHHENGVRHKGNVERFVRGLYKAGEKAVKDRDEETREMERINKAATAAYAQDVGAGLGGVGPSSRGAPVAFLHIRRCQIISCLDVFMRCRGSGAT